MGRQHLVTLLVSAAARASFSRGFLPLLEKELALRSNFLADGKLRQMWYDNPASIDLKRQIVTRLGLRGIGPYQLDSLDSNGTRTGNPRAQEESRRMWDTLSLGP